MTEDEEFLSDVGDVFGFLIARLTNDEEAAMVILNNTGVADLLLNLADFALAGVRLQAMELGLRPITVLRALARTAQIAGPEMLRECHGHD